ncbi:LuxR C-terminal-related transcriptional regulator [Kitasatospora sp. NPDC090091]|uniref:LuxR C-terminal-related transcriptional regulator n=1 Tax=Kitasatospora sp. NPDC090091 TaxID=3364081 RepID=UPI00381DED51
MIRPLTEFEAAVFRYRTQGLKNYEIDHALGRNITERTVHNAVLRAIRALGARTLDQAIQIHNQPPGAAG